MEKIDSSTHVDQLLSKYPALSQTFIEFGLPCLVCGEPFWGTIAELASRHQVNTDELVKKLNEVRIEIYEKT